MVVLEGKKRIVLCSPCLLQLLLTSKTLLGTISVCGTMYKHAFLSVLAIIPLSVHIVATSYSYLGQLLHSINGLCSFQNFHVFNIQTRTDTVLSD